MLLKLFRNNGIISPSLLVVYAVAFDFLNRTNTSTDFTSFSPLLSFFPAWHEQISGLLSRTIFVALTVVIAIFLNVVSVRKTLFTFSNYFVGFSFVLLSFALPLNKGMHEVALFSIPYLAFFITSLRQPSESRQLEQFLDLGMWLGLATLFYVPGALLILALPAISSIQKSREPRIWLASLIGFLSVWLIAYACALLFGVDLFAHFRLWWEMFSEHITQLTFTTPKLIALLLVFSLSVFAIYELVVFLHLKRVNNRRFFKITLYHTAIAVLMIILQWRFDHNTFFILAIPLSFLWANFIYYLPKALWRRALLELLLLSLIFLSFLF